MSTAATRWNTEEAARLARTAYLFVAEHYPPDADLEPLGVADRAVLKAQEAGNWDTFVEALRELMRTARREARRRAGQVTCALIRYLDPDFPQGQDGYPKDAEVEAILSGVAA